MMKAIKTKIVSIICVFSLLITTLAAASCENGNDSNVTDSTTESVTENSALSHIPERNLDGYKFKVLSRDGSQYTLDFFDDGTEALPVNTAIYTRNQTLQNKYGFEIVLYTVNSDQESAHSDELQRSVAAEDGSYDLGLIHTIAAGTLAANGDLYNWNKIPVLDFSKPWWSSNIINCLEIGNSLYMATNDSSIHSMSYAWGMVFNKELAADMKINEDFYGLVRNNEWTFDKLTEITHRIADDIDGVEGMGFDDCYGLGINWWGGTIAMMYGMGQTVCERDDDGYPVINFNTPKMNDIVEKMYSLMYDANSCMSPEYMPRVYDAFQEDRILICATVTSDIEGFRDMESEFGILPLPKYDDNQEDYLTMVDGHANMMCIPRYITDTERHGIILESIAALSNELVVPAYYDVTLQNKNTNDDDSKEMLDIIMDGRVYDFGYLYDIGGMSFIIYKLMEGRSTNFVSDYMSAEPSALTKIMNLVSKFEELEKQ